MHSTVPECTVLANKVLLTKTITKDCFTPETVRQRPGERNHSLCPGRRNEEEEQGRYVVCNLVTCRNVPEVALFVGPVGQNTKCYAFW